MGAARGFSRLEAGGEVDDLTDIWALTNAKVGASDVLHGMGVPKLSCRASPGARITHCARNAKLPNGGKPRWEVSRSERENEATPLPAYA